MGWNKGRNERGGDVSGLNVRRQGKEPVKKNGKGSS